MSLMTSIDKATGRSFTKLITTLYEKPESIRRCKTVVSEKSFANNFWKVNLR